MCDQNIRDDDNSYKELEFDRSEHRIHSIEISIETFFDIVILTFDL